MAKTEDNKSQNTSSPPVPGGSIFGKKPSIFSGGKNFQGKGFSGTRFTPPQIRITQNKGGGGK